MKNKIQTQIEPFGEGRYFGFTGFDKMPLAALLKGFYFWNNNIDTI